MVVWRVSIRSRAQEIAGSCSTAGGGGGFMSQPDYEHGIPNVTGLSILGTVTVDWAGGLGKDCACRRNDIPTAAHAQLTPRLTTESHRNTQSDWRLVIPYP